MPKNVFIQLGLNLSVEYSYLAKENFKKDEYLTFYPTMEF